jgi:hypothetical protein
LGNLTNIAVELWSVGPQQERHVLDIKDFVKDGVDLLWPEDDDTIFTPY